MYIFAQTWTTLLCFFNLLFLFLLLLFFLHIRLRFISLFVLSWSCRALLLQKCTESYFKFLVNHEKHLAGKSVNKINTTEHIH